jgi:[ribosomal protein S18]-alanine N-acetyltransferase
VTIREARRGEFDRLLAIDRAAFVPELAYSRGELWAWMTARRSVTLVFEEEGEVVGFVVGGWHRRGTGHVVTLDVAPARQRGGVGSALLAALEERFRRERVRLVYLETAVEGGARGFYERHGYSVAERISGYYNGALDAYVMTKPME